MQVSLSTQEILSVEPTGNPADRPASTLEAGLSDVRKENRNLERLIYPWLRTRYADPFAETVTRLKAARHWLTANR